MPQTDALQAVTPQASASYAIEGADPFALRDAARQASPEAMLAAAAAHKHREKSRAERLVAEAEARIMKGIL